MVYRILRILFVHRHLDVRGGAEKVLEILVQELSKAGDEIWLSSMRKPDTHEYLMEFVQRHPEQFFLFREKANKSKGIGLQLSRHIAAMRSVTAFRTVLRKIRADVSVSMTGSSEGTALSTLYLPSPRLFYMMGRISPAYGRPYQFATRLLLRKSPHEIVTGSKAMAEDFNKLFSYLPRWLYPPYEETYFTPEPSVKNESTIVMTGRMGNQKRFHYGIIAARKLLDRGVDFRLKIVGEVKYQPNTYYTHLRRMIDSLRLGGKVELIPSGDRNSLREAYREALVYWNMSVGYFGITNLEAIGCGAVPIVSPNLGEVVAETGVGHVACDLPDLVSVTEDALRTAYRTRSAGLEASRRIAERFGSRAFAIKFRDLLVEAIGISKKVP
jgi:glycosyltransferase involved in cell wall biosynthesis